MTALSRILRDLIAPKGRTRDIYIILSGAFINGCLAYVAQGPFMFLVPFLTGLYIALFLEDGFKSLVSALIVAFVCGLVFGESVHTTERQEILRLAIWNLVLLTACGGIGALAGAMPLGFGERWGRERFWSSVFILATAVTLVHGASVRGETLARALDHSPEPYKYRFDAWIYLRAFYLMERDPGAGYYACMVQAITEDDRGTRVTFPQNVRLPTVFVLWATLLPNFGGAIWRLYLVFSCLALWIAFKAMRQLGAYQRSVGLAGMTALVPHFFFIATDRYVLFPEAWAVFPTLAALWWYAARKRERASIAGMGAALTRETFGFVCLAGLFSALVNRKWRRAGVYAASILLLLGIYALHVRALKPWLPEDVPFERSLSQWAHLPEEGEGLLEYAGRLGGYFQSASSFGMNYYPFGLRGELQSVGENPIPWGRAPVRYVLLGMALLGIWKMRDAQNRWYAWGMVLFPILLVVLAAPHPRWGEYWGMLFMPVVVLMSPLALRKRGPGFPKKQRARQV